MLFLCETQQENARTLFHGPEMFRQAHQGVLQGEHLFHVHREGAEGYDLIYRENNELFLEEKTTGLHFLHTFLPPWLSYDVNDREKLSYEIFEGFSQVLFEEANEYTLTVAQVLLRDTSLSVFFSDRRVLWFFQESERLHYGQPHVDSSARTFVCTRQACENFMETGDTSRMGSVFVFHNVFLYQWLTNLPLNQVKYAFVTVLKIEGIGAVLDHFMRMKNGFASRGIQTYLVPGSSRFRDEMLRRYFAFLPLPEDTTEENTIYVPNFLPLRGSYMFFKYPGDIHKEDLNQKYLKEIEEYYEAVFQDEKVLGILIRGTDYVSLKMGGSRTQATAEEMIPIAEKWMAEDGYDRIFLATEDADVLEQMYAHFGNRLRAVSQVRHRVSELKKGEYLSDLDTRHPAYDKDAIQEDTTANYFYALVILSRCTSFLASGSSNGWDVVNSLNEGRFLRSWKWTKTLES